jgi:hypothetical protein
MFQNSLSEAQESRDLPALLQYRAHEIFRYVSVLDERQLNFENRPRMNCVDIVESAANVWRRLAKRQRHAALLGML